MARLMKKRERNRYGYINCNYDHDDNWDEIFITSLNYDLINNLSFPFILTICIYDKSNSCFYDVSMTIYGLDIYGLDNDRVEISSKVTKYSVKYYDDGEGLTPISKLEPVGMISASTFPSDDGWFLFDDDEIVINMNILDWASRVNNVPVIKKEDLISGNTIIKYIHLELTR